MGTSPSAVPAKRSAQQEDREEEEEEEEEDPAGSSAKRRRMGRSHVTGEGFSNWQETLITQSFAVRSIMHRQS